MTIKARAMTAAAKIRALFKFKPFSAKQLKVLTWWTPESPVRHKDGIIADGAIRSGKTLSMALSFTIWAMASFDLQNFALCGKSIGSLRRNVVTVLKLMLRARGYRVRDHKTENMLTIVRNGIENYFYLFGGRDESSQDLIQGITLAGVLFDEVALMPESFVNQATARCSVDGSKFWFNCNPGSPLHWFKQKWIDGIREADPEKRKNLVYLHFTMDDNLSLTEATKARYRSLYVGVFYQRYILGLWKKAEGLIYPMFSDGNLYDDESRPVALLRGANRHISIDYGTQNPMVYLDIYDDGQVSWQDQEYYYSGRSTMRQKTDDEYYQDLVAFVDANPYNEPVYIIIDPSAASFIAKIKAEGRFFVRQADNTVEDGLRRTGTAVQRQIIMVHRNCHNTIAEFGSYAWDEKKVNSGKEQPLKENDHTMDAWRYFVNTIIKSRVTYE